MMTKFTMTTTIPTNTKVETRGKSNYASNKAETSAKTNKETSFDKLIDQHIDHSELEKNLNVDNQTSTEKNSSSRSRDELQELRQYDNIDSSRLEQLKQGFQKQDKEGVVKNPLHEGTEVDDTEELAALVASLNKLFQQDNRINVNDNGEKISVALTSAFSDIMDEMKAGALSSKDSLGKSTIDKLTDLIGKANAAEGISGENSKNLVEMLTGLLNVLKTGEDNNLLDNETQKLETVRVLSEQLLNFVGQMLGKEQFSDNSGKAVDNRSINAIIQLVVNKTELLIKAENGNQSNTDAKKGIGDKIKETLETILSVSSQDSEVELKSIIEQLVTNLFAKPDNQKNQSMINEILNKYGFSAAETINNSDPTTLEEFKARLTNVLMLMAKDMKAEKTSALGVNGNTIDRFAEILEGNLGDSDNTAMKAKTVESTNENNSSKAVGNKLTMLEGKEDKLLNSILGKEDKGTDSKTEKVNNFISQLNSSKDEIGTEKITDKPLVTKSNFSQDIIKTVKYMNLNNLKELTVKIAPKELGEITIRITMTDGNIKANISANTKEAFHLLSNHIGEITASLGNNEIKIQEANVSIYQEDASLMRDNSNKNEDGQASRNRNAKKDEVAGISEIIESIAEDNNISILV